MNQSEPGATTTSLPTRTPREDPDDERHPGPGDP
jgi:hypothetical protein